VRYPTLLVLDGLEHIPEVWNLVADILDGCKLLRVLVTSRSPLGLYGEREFAVPPLETPPPSESSRDEDLSRNPAVMLLVERAQAVNRGFKLTKGNASCLAEICRRLDGLPLAIELAAARCKTLTPSALLAKLSSPLTALESGPVDRPARHQKLRAAIDWSWDLLSESEQKLFRRLAVFTAGFTYESAEAVADAACDLSISASEGVDSLVDRSMLNVVEPLDEEPFFSMLQTVREYGLDKLQESGESLVIRRALAAYCLVVAEEGWTPNGNEGNSAWMARCEAEYLNIAESLRWLIDQQQAEWAARISLALFPYWERYDLLSEGHRHLERLIDLPNLTQRHRAMASSNVAALVCLQSGLDAGVRAHEDAIALARDLGDLQCISREANAMGGACHRKGDLRSALEFFEEALEACRELGDRAQEAAILSNIAEVASEAGDYARADELSRKTVGIFLALGHHSGLAWSFHRLGDHERRQGNRDAAEHRYEEALKLFRALKDPWGVGLSLQRLADLCCQAGNYRDAEAMFGEALALCQGMRRKRGVGLLLDNLAAAQASLGRRDCALTLAGAASGLRESLGLEERPWSPEDSQRRDKILAQAGVELDRVALDDAWDRGVKMTLSEAVDFARQLEWSLFR
jgi:predicted ATPase